MTKTKSTHEAGAPGARRLTPQQQLWEISNESQHRIFRQVMRRLKKRDQEDLCYGMIAYIRFGVRRPFECPFMQVLFESFIDLSQESLAGETLIKQQQL